MGGWRGSCWVQLEAVGWGKSLVVVVEVEDVEVELEEVVTRWFLLTLCSCRWRPVRCLCFSACRPHVRSLFALLIYLVPD